MKSVHAKENNIVLDKSNFSSLQSDNVSKTDVLGVRFKKEK